MYYIGYKRSDLLLGNEVHDPFQRLICEGKERAHRTLPVLLEQYLVYLLKLSANCTIDGALVPHDTRLALVYGRALNEPSPSVRGLILEELGQRAILLSCFFPELARRRNVSTAYFRNMALNSYGYLADIDERRARHTPVLKELRSLSVQVIDHFDDVVNVLTATTQPTMHCTSS